jgi:hypothetical protein
MGFSVAVKMLMLKTHVVVVGVITTKIAAVLMYVQLIHRNDYYNFDDNNYHY